MKQLFILLLLVLGSAAYANNNEGIVPPPNTDQETVTSKKITAKPRIAEPAKPVMQKETHDKMPARKTATTNECSSRFGITEYFVDIVHHSNVKLVKLLL